MSPFIGDDRSVHIDPLTWMRNFSNPLDVWAVYQNVALDSRDLSHMKFLKIGEGCTFKEAPERLPDTEREINWRYMHVGYVDMKNGVVIDHAPFPDTNGKEPASEIQDGDSLRTQKK